MQAQEKLAYDYGEWVAGGQTSMEPAVIPGSPAAKAGIVTNDIVLEADGQKLTADVSLSRLVEAKNPGDTMTLKIAHQGKEKTVTVTLAEVPAPYAE